MNDSKKIEKIILKASIRHFSKIEQKLLDLKKSIDIADNISDILTDEESKELMKIYYSAIDRLNKKLDKGGK